MIQTPSSPSNSTYTHATLCNPSSITSSMTDLSRLKSNFHSGHFQSTKSRLEHLNQLCIIIDEYRQAFINALIHDGHCSREAIFELKTTEAQINRLVCPPSFTEWASNVPIETGFLTSPSISTSRTARGLVQIIPSSQYPVMHALVPLASAIAAGNVVVLCPNPRSLNVYQLLIQALSLPCLHVQQSATYVSSCVDFVYCADSFNVEVGLNAGALGIHAKFDSLDRKCICIVDDPSILETACKRIVESSFTSAGFFPYKPNYILTLPSLQPNLIYCLQQSISQMYTTNPFWDHEYSRCPTVQLFDLIKSNLLTHTDLVACSTLKLNNRCTSESRTMSLLNQLLNDKNCAAEQPATAGVVFGGQWSEDDSLIVYPTVVVCDKLSALLTEHTLGPVLPVVVLTQPEIDLFLHDHQPFDILYHFSTRSSAKYQQSAHYFRAIVVNDTLSPFRVNDYISQTFYTASPSSYALFHDFSRQVPYISNPINRLVGYRDDCARYPPTTQKKLSALENQMRWRNVPVPSQWWRKCRVWAGTCVRWLLVRSLKYTAVSLTVSCVAYFLKRHQHKLKDYFV